MNEQDKLDATMTFLRLCRNPPDGCRLSTILREIETMFPMYSAEEIKKALRPAMYEMTKLLVD